MARTKQSQAGRALLLELLARHEIPEEHLCDLMGMEAIEKLGPPDEQHTFEVEPQASEEKRYVMPAKVGPALPSTHMPFWAITEYQRLEEKQDSKQLRVQLDANFFKHGSPYTGVSEPLWHSGQIRPRLISATRTAVPGRRIDAQTLVRQMGRDLLPKRIPTLRINAYKPGLWLVLDYRRESLLFRFDVNRIKKLVEEQLGEPGEKYQQIHVTSSTAWGYLMPLKLGRTINLKQIPHESRIVLVSPDLSNAQESWHSLYEIAKARHAQIIRLDVALNPGSPAKLPVHSYRERAPQGPRYSTGDLSALDYLLACIAQCWEVCPALLRDLRHLLPLNEAPVSVEAEVWQSADIVRVPGGGLTVKSDALSRSRKQFLKLPSETQCAALAQIEKRHQVWPAELKLWERACWASQGLGYEDSSQTWAALAQHLAAKKGQAGMLASWVLGAADRQSPEFWQSDVGEQMARAVRIASQMLPGSSVPEAVGVQTEDDQYSYYLYPKAKGIQVTTNPANAFFTLYRFRSGLLYYRQGEQLQQVKPNEAIHQEDIHFVHKRAHIRLKKIERPPFATEIEQTPNGLFCTLANGRRLRWCYPGEAFNGLLHPLHAPGDTVKATWVDETQWNTFHHSKHLPYLPEGAVLGKDKYGAYADINLNLGLIKRMVKGQVTLRMRWIPPGEFHMGSPEDEAEREEGEVLHRVLITRGYWLAETACTQQLWQAVINKNPSRFKGEDLPVDSVSWNDVQDFCRRLNKHEPHFLARLPSEAEWEYACRASTTTPFWWGERLSTEQANYDGSRPYDKGEKGEYRRRTLATKSFNANPWGLYQVHGNVWEWCQDWHGGYEQKQWTLDPGGVERGARRVLRGGGWIGSGRWLRAACRNADLPVRPVWVFDGQGFRLAAGGVGIGGRQGGAV